MIKQKNTLSEELKMQIVLELFAAKDDIKKLASKYGTSVKNIQNWKEQFLANAHLAFAPKTAQEIKNLKKQNAKMEKLTQKLEREIQETAQKLKELDIDAKRRMIDDSSELSIAQQCKIIDLNRPSLYYKSKVTDDKDELIKQKICEIYVSQKSKGYRAIHKKLIEDGYKIGINKVNKLMNLLAEQNALPQTAKENL
ncbi:MAG: transposase [Campylobacter sp.]|nr:transposase [Campylobacter sp.]